MDILQTKEKIELKCYFIKSVITCTKHKSEYQYVFLNKFKINIQSFI